MHLVPIGVLGEFIDPFINGHIALLGPAGFTHDGDAPQPPVRNGSPAYCGILVLAINTGGGDPEIMGS